MSFGINGPDNIPSIQKSHHTNDGGAGNLGYFQRERKKKEEKEESDVFEFSKKEDEDDPLMVELDSIGSRIKGFWKKFNENFKDKDETESKDDENEEKKPEDE